MYFARKETIATRVSQKMTFFRHSRQNKTDGVDEIINKPKEQQQIPWRKNKSEQTDCIFRA